MRGHHETKADIIRLWMTLTKRLSRCVWYLRIRRLGVRIPSRARDEPFGAFHTGRLFFILAKRSKLRAGR